MVKGNLFSQLNQYKFAEWKTELVPVSKLTYNQVAQDLYSRTQQAQYKIQESIRKNGLRYFPFVTNTHEVLDGIIRVEAYKALHITHIMCYVVQIAPDEYQQFIVSANHRREKTKSELYDEALLLVPLPSQGKQHVVEEGRQNTKRYEIGAKLAGKQFGGSTLRMYETAKKIDHQYPDAGLLKQFNNGTIKSVNALHTAAKLVEERYAEQSDAKKPIEIPLHVPKKFAIYYKECDSLESGGRMSEIEDESVQLTFTSPPYWDQREYREDKTVVKTTRPPWGKEKTVEEYIDRARGIFLEVYRVTKFRGSVFVNISDTYSCDANNYIPELFCIMMSQIGFHKLNTIPWVKTNNRTKGNEDRRLLPSWEYLFHFVKKEAASSKTQLEQRYKYTPFLYYPEEKRMKVHEIGPRHNKDGSKTKAKVIVTKAFSRLQDFFNSRTYFDIIETATASADCAFLNKQYQIEHKAPFPLQLPLYSILSCSDEGDTVLDMCMGSGTTAVASMLMGRIAVGYECEKTFHDLATRRCTDIEIGLSELAEERKTA